MNNRYFMSIIPLQVLLRLTCLNFVLIYVCNLIPIVKTNRVKLYTGEEDVKLDTY